MKTNQRLDMCRNKNTEANLPLDDTNLSQESHESSKDGAHDGWKYEKVNKTKVSKIKKNSKMQTYPKMMVHLLLMVMLGPRYLGWPSYNSRSSNDSQSRGLFQAIEVHEKVNKIKLIESKIKL